MFIKNIVYTVYVNKHKNLGISFFCLPQELALQREPDIRNRRGEANCHLFLFFQQPNHRRFYFFYFLCSWQALKRRRFNSSRLVEPQDGAPLHIKFPDGHVLRRRFHLMQPIQVK